MLDKRGRRSAKFARRVRFAVSRFTDVVVNNHAWGLRISSYPRVSPGIPPYPAISRHIPPYPAADTAKRTGQPRHISLTERSATTGRRIRRAPKFMLRSKAKANVDENFSTVTGEVTVGTHTQTTCMRACLPSSLTMWHSAYLRILPWERGACA